MSRYINADLIEYHDSFTNDGEYARVAFGDDIDALPTADVVEVVRCEDCRYWDNRLDVMVCNLTDGMKGASDYCSFGERREKGNAF